MQTVQPIQNQSIPSQWVQCGVWALIKQIATPKSDKVKCIVIVKCNFKQIRLENIKCPVAFYAIPPPNLIRSHWPI